MEPAISTQTATSPGSENAMHRRSQNLRLETLNSDLMGSSAAPNPSSTLPNCSSDLPKPSSRAQLEPFVFEPLSATLSRQTPCEISAEKTASHLSPKPNSSQLVPGILKQPTHLDRSSRAHLPLNMSTPHLHNPLPGCTFHHISQDKTQNMSAPAILALSSVILHTSSFLHYPLPN